MLTVTNPAVRFWIYVLVALMWFIPDRRIEDRVEA